MLKSPSSVGENLVMPIFISGLMDRNHSAFEAKPTMYHFPANLKIYREIKGEMLIKPQHMHYTTSVYTILKSKVCYNLFFTVFLLDFWKYLHISPTFFRSNSLTGVMWAARAASTHIRALSIINIMFLMASGLCSGLLQWLVKRIRVM